MPQTVNIAIALRIMMEARQALASSCYTFADNIGSNDAEADLQKRMFEYQRAKNEYHNLRETVRF